MSEIVTTEPDWSDIEKAYRAGRETLRAIGERNGITEGAIRKRARRDQWERDLHAKIQARAEVLVRKTEVRKSVRKERELTERTEIEVAATLQAGVVLGQRKDIVRHRGLVGKLFAELEATTDSLELMEQIGELMYKPDEAGIDKLNELYRKVISLPGRVDMAKKLVETLEKLINAERRVFNIKEDDADKSPSTVVEVRLVALAAAVSS